MQFYKKSRLIWRNSKTKIKLTDNCTLMIRYSHGQVNYTSPPYSYSILDLRFKFETNHRFENTSPPYSYLILATSSRQTTRWRIQAPPLTPTRYLLQVPDKQPVVEYKPPLLLLDTCYKFQTNHRVENTSPPNSYSILATSYRQTTGWRIQAPLTPTWCLLQVPDKQPVGEYKPPPPPNSYSILATSPRQTTRCRIQAPLTPTRYLLQVPDKPPGGEYKPP